MNKVITFHFILVTFFCTLLIVDAAVLPPPILIAPEDSIVHKLEPITFQWDSVPGAIGYNIIILNSEQPNSLDLNIIVKDNNNKKQLSVKCNNYQWKVRAFDKDSIYGDWSETRSLLRMQPVNPVLAYPPMSFSGYLDIDKFGWDIKHNTYLNVDTCRRFIVRLDTNPNFTSVNSISVESRILEIKSPVLLSDRIYYWKVISINNCYDSVYSDVFTFRTKNWTHPDSAKLIEPENNATYVEWGRLGFTWKVKYKTDFSFLIISKNLDFSEVVYIYKVPVDRKDSIISFRTNINLEKMTKYFWKIVNTQDTFKTESQVFTFTTGTLSDIELKKNYNIVFTPNPALDYIELSTSNVFPLQDGADRPAERILNSPVIIYDLLGNKVFDNSQLSIFNSKIRIDVTHLAPGVYFVRAGDVVRKFVKL